MKAALTVFLQLIEVIPVKTRLGRVESFSPVRRLRLWKVKTRLGRVERI